jgi:gamma-glutamylaminecyclotransferase
MIRLFVYGTLKRGFPLHAAGLTGQRLVGIYRTVVGYPMVVAGPWFTPMMLNEPGRGLRVYGELYEVEANRLVSLDAIEHIGVPGNCRGSIDVEPIEGGACCAADVYLKARELADPIHTAYLVQDHRFVPPWSRQPDMSRSG